ncbi:Olfactory receptor 5B12 [Fukomys damarensis]|uniref:Olfactory receptor 5B12 n=1 Tax=Fukomys damarensis TaxID=885580 RepID=A0A091E3A2_FUKDA|nr:Olfactory receptor 5B12 [Fukomys damarensis]
MENRTQVTEFLLLGLTDDPHLRLPLFITFLLIYTITIAGNLGMLLLILLDPRLHTPMYYFLGNLSLVDFFSSSVVTPTVMKGLLTGNKPVPFYCRDQDYRPLSLTGRYFLYCRDQDYRPLSLIGGTLFYNISLYCRDQNYRPVSLTGRSRRDQSRFLL